ncbi:MAG: radical SAM protein, partial [Selenomonadaceae bacterium]|nr:radical SAM protein [Selenomonadaceae bacterium]
MGIKGKRYLSNRTKLETVIPLETPFLLFVDPSSACNFKCKFCPCGGGNREVWGKNKKPSIMTYELYRKIIDDLTEFPEKIKTLRLYKEGEPLLNKRLPDMIRYARAKDVVEKIDFTTNASLLTHDLGLAIADAGLDRINISVEAMDEEGYFSVSGVKINLSEYMENLRFFHQHKNGCHVFIKISDLGLGNHTEKDFYEMFGDLCDEIAVEHVTNVWPEFSVKEELKSTE